MTPTWIRAALPVAVLLAATASAETFPHPDDMKIPDLGEVDVPDFERTELANGLVLYLLEDHEFPMVEVRTITRGGDAYDPADKIGLASLTAEVMRTGGAGEITGDDLDALVEDTGTELSMTSAGLSFEGSLSVLSANLDQGLDLLRDMLLDPMLPVEKLDEARVGLRTSIASRNDDAIQLAIRELAGLAYGKDTPYGWYPEYATIAAIEPGDLRAVHETFFLPNQTIVVAWGDVDAGEMKAHLEARFGDWARAEPAYGDPPPVPTSTEAGLYYAEKSDVTNAVVLVGNIGIRRNDPMYPAAMVLQEVLGGGFASRIFSEIRTRRGLAYSAGTGIQAPYSRKGTALAYVLTQADSTTTSTRLLLQEVEKVREASITEDELTWAKDRIQNGFVFQFASPGDVVMRQARYEFHGYDPDFLTTYQEGIRAVTTADMQAAARAIFRPEEWQILVVGNDDDFAEPLSSIMPVNDLDISIPAPPVEIEIPDATPASLQRGQEIVAEMIAAHGGSEVVDGVSTVTIEAKGQAQVQGMSLQIDMMSVTQYPERIYGQQSVFGQTSKQVVVGDEGWVIGPMGTNPMSPEDVAEARDNSISDGHLAFLQTASELEVQALDPQEIAGTPHEVLHVRDLEDAALLLFVDAETHLVTRTQRQGQNPMTGAPAEMTMVMRDFRDVDGVPYPYAMEMLLDGESFLTVTTTSVALDAPVDDSLFEKPEGM